MSKFTPWTKEQAEQWARECADMIYRCADPQQGNPAEQVDPLRFAFLAGLAKAAEMIEASPTVWGSVGEYGSTFSTYQPGTFIQENNTHKAKLVGAQPIEKEEPSDDQA